MTAGQWRSLVVLAGDWALDAPYAPRHPGAVGAIGGVGVYVAERLDGTDVYVGSVVRRTAKDGMARRIREHILADTSEEAARRWHRVHLLPLREDTPVAEVRRIEGVVGRVVAPEDGRRLPGIGAAVQLSQRHPVGMSLKNA